MSKEIDMMLDKGILFFSEKNYARQHYLRYDPLKTPQIMDNLGIYENSTLGHFSKPGFRCSTCYKFPMYDLKNRKPLKLLQSPLIFIDVSLTCNNIPFIVNFRLVKYLFEKVKKYNGIFNILWHNNELYTKMKRKFYTKHTQLGFLWGR